MPGEFELQTHNRGRGKVGEEDAVRWLEARGFAILDKNVVTHAGEIDLVAREGETLCFIEVKARGTAAFGPAIAAVGPAKQRRICRAAALYLALRGLSGDCRFDVLGLDAAENGWTYTLIRDAFPYQG